MSKRIALWLMVSSIGAGVACSSQGAGTSTASSSSAASSGASSSSTSAGSSSASAASSAGGTGASSSSVGGTGGSAGASTGVAGTGGTGGVASTGSAGGAAGGAGGGSVVGPLLVINEIVADEVSGSDWVELYNAGDQPADLTGWTMTDSDPTHVFAFPANTVLAPDTYLTLDQNAAGSFTFGLGKGGDQVNVYDVQAQLVDGAAWTAGQADAPTSWGRLPNGTGAFQTFATPTKGAKNQ